MKVTKHVEHLLKQGRKPKELVELGFPKSIVTKVRRQLTKEKTVPQTKIPQEAGQAESHPEELAESAHKLAKMQQKLESLEGGLRKVDSLAKLLSEVAVLVAAAQEVGTDKREDCPHEEDGVCTLYTWTSRDEIPQGVGEPVLVENEKSEWHIKPTPFYCAMCTAFLEERIDEVESQTFDTPLWGARHRITCSGCGSKGWIATAIKCTKCGRITYWGWWPKKE